MGKAKSIILTYLSLDIIIKTFLGFFCSSIIYLMFNDRLVLQYIPINTKNLVKIGAATSVKGDVVRKLTQDSLHLPIFASYKIYQDDLIVTGEASTADIEIEPANFIITEPNSAFRLRIEGKNIFIQFHKGNLITRFTEEKIINLKQGTQTTKVQIRKGTYLIKNSNAGIQITNFSSQSKLKKSNSDNLSAEIKHQFQNPLDEDQKISEDQKLADEKKLEQTEVAKDQLNEKQLATPLSLPHPNDNTVFLIKTAHTLTLAAKDICNGICKLSLYKDKKLIIEKIYETLQVPTYDYNLEENTSGHFEWSYIDSEDSFKLSFEVAPFSTESFDKALQAGLPIEIY